MLMAEELFNGVNSHTIAHSASIRQMLQKASRTLKPVLLSKTLDRHSLGNTSIDSIGNVSKRLTISKSPSSKRDLSIESNISLISPCVIAKEDNSPPRGDDSSRHSFTLEF